jgi:hypothetical protein
MQPAQIALGQQQLHTEGQVAVVEERNACTRTLLEAPIASKLIVLAALASRAWIRAKGNDHGVTNEFWTG